MFPPDRRSPAVRSASAVAELRSGCPDPSATPAALSRTGFRSYRERSAALSCPRCCRPSLRRPEEALPASSLTRSPLAYSPAAHRDCSRIWLWDSVRLPPPHTCSSGRIIINRIPHRINLSSVAVNVRTILVYVLALDPDTGTAGLFPRPQNLAPAARPSRSGRTTAGAPETRCPDRSADSPPAVPAPVPRTPFPVLPATSPPRTDPVVIAATARTPTS